MSVADRDTLLRKSRIPGRVESLCQIPSILLPHPALCPRYLTIKDLFNRIKLSATGFRLGLANGESHLETSGREWGQGIYSFGSLLMAGLALSLNQRSLTAPLKEADCTWLFLIPGSNNFSPCHPWPWAGDGSAATNSRLLHLRFPYTS